MSVIIKAILILLKIVIIIVFISILVENYNGRGKK